MPSLLAPPLRLALAVPVELSMAGIALFMLIWGLKLVQTTWYQAIGDFPLVSAGLSYLPVPIGGTITFLFVVERFWTGRLWAPPHTAEELAHFATE